MDSTTDAKHLSELIDKNTVVNDNGVLKVKKLDGQEVTIAEINHLKGLTMNVMNLVNSFANGGVKVYEHTIPTYADLSTLDRSTFIDGIKYFVYVQSDETHGGAKTTYLCDKKSTSYFCVSGDHRDFTTSPINLANEVTGKLATSNIDVDALWKLLTINDTYKTLTTKNEVFGTHGAKALYDELVADIGKKANATDLTTHTGDTNIHVTTADKTKWNNVDNKVNKTDIIDNLTSTNTDKPLSANQGKVLKGEVDKKANDNEVIKKTSITTTINSTSTDSQVPSAKAIYNKTKNRVIRIENDGDIIAYADSLGNEAVTETIRITNGINSPYGANDKDNDFHYTIYNMYDARFKRIVAYDIRKNDMYMIMKYGGRWRTWQRVCTTSVADVPVTDIKFTSTTNYKPSTQVAFKYTVSNGICYVSGGIQCVSSNNSYITVCTLPKPKNGWQYCKTFRIDGSRDESSTVMMLINENGELELSMGTATGEYRCTFSYPVKES